MPSPTEPATSRSAPASEPPPAPDTPHGASEPTPAPDTHRGASEAPLLSIVVLQWDNLDLTRRCVDSIRRGTDVPHELILVDNGSLPDAVAYAREAGDVVIENARNLGFAAGMNQGLAAAGGDYVAFVNNDTVLPPGWASTLIDTAKSDDSIGIVCPAVTTAGHPRTVRSEPGDQVELLAPFDLPPSAVVYLMPTRLARDLGGFGEEFPIASGEDLDLAFKVWVNHLDIAFDQRVLVEHVGHATSDTRLEDRRERWSTNRAIFAAKWQDPDAEVPRLPHVSDRDFARNRVAAAASAEWIRQWFELRDELREAKRTIRAHEAVIARQQRQLHEATRGGPVTRGLARLLGRVWRLARRVVPRPVRERLFPALRPLYYRAFPERRR